MMTGDTVGNSVFFVLAFLVPGFIWYSVLTTIVPRKPEEKDKLFLRYMTLSSLNYAFWSWLVYLLFSSQLFISHPIRSSLAWFLIIFISPVIFGFVSGKSNDKNYLEKFLRPLGINPINPIPTAWDFVFYNTKEPVWILVTMKDGSMVGGRFGTRSFASSDPDERDVYIQEVFKIDEEGPWQRIPQNNGILVKSDEIKYIEFWP